jgi:hypothetical protein
MFDILFSCFQVTNLGIFSETAKKKCKKITEGLILRDDGCSYRNCHPSFVILQRELLEAAVCQGFD